MPKIQNPPKKKAADKKIYGGGASVGSISNWKRNIKRKA